MALHVLWDCPEGVRSTDNIKKFSDRYGVLPGSINPNLFQDQEYKYGSFGNPDPLMRQRGADRVRQLRGMSVRQSVTLSVRTATATRSMSVTVALVSP